ncbi:short transient receptor potential channel 1-like [Ptychodera flava]|uniref:short transient receptor potential channel 1-like n=1 Tax=Ptychodera flava TaxID=63121 RepID=UPI00396A7F4E
MSGEDATAVDPASVRSVLENIFLDLVDRGEKTGVLMALDRSECFNVNCVDKTGRGALTIALQNANLVMLEILVNHPAVQLDDILLRAVHVQMLPAVEIICNGLKLRDLLPDGLTCHCTNDDFHADMTPVILAAHQNNYAILKVLLDQGAEVPLPECFSFKTREFSLEHSIGTINIYKAVTSEAFLSLTSEDPFKDAFTLSNKMRELSVVDFEFRSDYLEMAERCENFAANLLHYVKDSDEQQIVMTNCSGRRKDTAKISTAIKYEQKKFVAHAHCQQFLVEKWYNGLSQWKKFSRSKAFLLSCIFGICYPIISICFAIAGNSRPGKLLKVPYVRFISHLSSTMIFLMLLTLQVFVDTKTRLSGDQGDTIVSLFPSVVEILIFLWVIAYTCLEFYEICSKGRNYLSLNKQSKALDLFTLALFWSWIILRIFAGIEVYVNSDMRGPSNVKGNMSLPAGDDVFIKTLVINCNHGNQCNIPLQREYKFSEVADAKELIPNIGSKAEACGNVECSFRVEDVTTSQSPEDEEVMNARYRRGVIHYHDRGERKHSRSNLDVPLYNMEATHPFLLAEGILAIAKVFSFLKLARMTVVHFQIGPMQISFGRMGGAICKFLVIFTVLLFAFSVGMHQLFYLYARVQCEDNENCSDHLYTSMPRSVVTLFWTLFGMTHISTLQVGDSWTDRWFTEAVANVLFAIYHVLAVIVLLNVLIAMMSHTYQLIESDADMEWKYSRSLLWLSFFEDSAALAPPFNLLQVMVCLGKLVKKSTRKEAKLLQRTNVPTTYKILTQKIVDRYVFDKLLQEERDSLYPTMLKLKQSMLDLQYGISSTLDSLSSKLSNIQGAVCDEVEDAETDDITRSLKTAIANAEKLLPIRTETFIAAAGRTEDESIRFFGDSSDEDHNSET